MNIDSPFNHVLMAPPFPDGEIINGFLARIHRYNGASTLRQITLQVLNRVIFLDGMPSSIRKFHEELGHLYGTIDELIDKHTEFNYLCCGLPAKRIDEQRKRLLTGHDGPVRLTRLPILFSAIENAYKICPECAEQQLDEYGFSFIHRRTGAPFVNVCSIHGNALRPLQMKLFEEFCQTPASPYQIQRAMDYAVLVDECICGGTNSGFGKNSVTAQLQQTNWMNASGRLYLKEFLDRFHSFFSGSFSDERLNALCSSEKYIVNALRALLREDRAIHPTWLILFKWFVDNEHGPKRAFNPVQSSDVHGMLVREVIQSKEALLGLLQEHSTVRRAAIAAGINADKFRTLCKKYGIALNWRAKKLTAEVIKNIHQLYVRGKEHTQISAEMSLSLSTIYRVVNSHPQHSDNRRKNRNQVLKVSRHLWKELIQQSEGHSRTEIRKANQVLFTRLYRGDRDWLNAHQVPRKKRIRNPNSAPDQRLLGILDQSVQQSIQLGEANGRSGKYVSLYKLQKLTGASEHVLNTYVANKWLQQGNADKNPNRLTRGQMKAGRKLPPRNVKEQETAGEIRERKRKASKA